MKFTRYRATISIKSGKLTRADTVVDARIVDLLDWLTLDERTYQEAIDVWHTSCPRLTVWDGANDRKLVATEMVNAREIVRITRAGFAFREQRKAYPKNLQRPDHSRPE